MDSTLLAGLIGAVATVFAALVAALLGIRFGRKHTYDDLGKTMDAVIELLRARLKKKEPVPKAFTVLHELRAHHSLNNIVAALYLLREKEIINWEDANILKPDHRIELKIH